MAQLTWQVVDHSGESSSITLHVADVDDTNINDVIGGTVGAAYYDLNLAMGALCLGNFGAVTLNQKVAQNIPTNPLDPNAQRENKLMIKYIDTVTGKKYRTTIPAPSNAFRVIGTDKVDPDDADWFAFAAVFEAHCLSEAGNPVQILDGVYVGRNI